MPKPKTPRTNKTKEQLIQEIARKEKVEREKSLCRLIWPFIGELDTIYDAQTAVTALSGFISADIKKKTDALKVSDLTIDLSGETPSKIVDAVKALHGLVEHETAVDVASLLERFGRTLAMYSSNEFMKNPMKILTVDNIIA